VLSFTQLAMLYKKKPTMFKSTSVSGAAYANSSVAASVSVAVALPATVTTSVSFPGFLCS